MDKKLRAYLSITIILIIGAVAATVMFYDLDRLLSPRGDIFQPPKHEVKLQPYDRFIRGIDSPQNESHAPVKKLIAGICGFLLVGYLLVNCYQKFMKDSKKDLSGLENSLREISLDSGRTEYELFVIAAEDWSITEAQIEEDFKNYMGSNFLPYYVKDLVRKNKDRINESLEKKEEIKPTSKWDLVKALLVFPGSLLIPYFFVITFGNFA